MKEVNNPSHKSLLDIDQRHLSRIASEAQDVYSRKLVKRTLRPLMIISFGLVVLSAVLLPFSEPSFEATVTNYLLLILYILPYLLLVALGNYLAYRYLKSNAQNLTKSLIFSFGQGKIEIYCDQNKLSNWNKIIRYSLRIAHIPDRSIEIENITRTLIRKNGIRFVADMQSALIPVEAENYTQIFDTVQNNKDLFELPKRYQVERNI